MRLRNWGQALFCFVFVIGLAARVEAARLRLSVPVHGVSHVAFYAAKEKGYFQEEGLDVEMILMSAAIGFRALIAGDVDASTVGGSALPPIFRGAPLRMVFISFDKPTHWLYAKPDIRTVKDLKNRKVAIDGLGGTLESLLRSVLEKNGLEGGRDVPFLAIGTPPGRENSTSFCSTANAADTRIRATNRDLCIAQIVSERRLDGACGLPFLCGAWAGVLSARLAAFRSRPTWTGTRFCETNPILPHAQQRHCERT